MRSLRHGELLLLSVDVIFDAGGRNVEQKHTFVFNKLHVQYTFETYPYKP
jgi:hypothetical protein